MVLISFYKVVFIPLNYDCIFFFEYNNNKKKKKLILKKNVKIL